MYGIIHLLTVGHSDSIHERIFRKKSADNKSVRGDKKKYYILILLGYMYQSILDKYEPVHEIFILIAYT